MAWADLTDCRAYYELIGEGEPLLLIPGLGATCRLWDPIVPELAQHFTLIMLDNRGTAKFRVLDSAGKSFAAGAAQLAWMNRVEGMLVCDLSTGADRL